MRDALLDPPHEFSLMPFWFWNDALDAAEIVRQMDDFEHHGVHGFVIHPRVGLPRDCGWMSERLLGFMQVAIDEAARRGMKVILYDEGMYPSGSSCGQVVANWPELACRCLALHEGESVPAGATVVGEIDKNGRKLRVIDRACDAYIRGLHYIGEGPAEDEPAAADILNPRTADAVIELVYSVFHKHFGAHFGKTILGIFTDEPNPLGKCREKRVWAGTTGIVEQVSRLLGYDFAPHVPALWSDLPEDEKHRAAWRHAIRMRMSETWYRPLSDWCAAHGIALCGHPDRGDEIGAERFFHIPGQDLVWRWVEPGKPTSVEGHESTQGKCSSSAMIHLGRRRNSNEFAGAYGAETTFEEVKALANWCLVRGVNLLIPHAFYYSVRGPRLHERPPQIGPHTPAWETDEFKRFADACRRLCWVNTDSKHVCHVAILTHHDECTWPAAKVLLQHQRDFNYLDPQTLLESASVDRDGISIAGMRYTLLVIEGDDALSPELESKLKPLIERGRVARWGAGATDPTDLLAAIDRAGAPPVRVRSDSRDVRVRIVEKRGCFYAMVFNEGAGEASVSVHADGLAIESIDPSTGARTSTPPKTPGMLRSFELQLLRVMHNP